MSFSRKDKGVREESAVLMGRKGKGGEVGGYQKPTVGSSLVKREASTRGCVHTRVETPAFGPARRLDPTLQREVWYFHRWSERGLAFISHILFSSLGEMDFRGYI